MSELDSNQTQDTGDGEPKEPSLGPACLVVTILSLAVMCSVCAFGSWFMFSDQYPLAIKGINVQLIPWIQSSQLSEQDQTAIIADLEALVPQIESRSLNSRQLARLRNCLHDNPVLLWGAIEELQRLAQDVDLNETELQVMDRVVDRLLRGAAERILSRNDIEFTLHNCSRVRDDGQSLEVVGPLTAEQVRDFMTRAEQVVERNQIPNESYDSTPSKAFRQLLTAALDVSAETANN